VQTRNPLTIHVFIIDEWNLFLHKTHQSSVCHAANQIS